jgi:hypothetical protein
MALWTAGAKVLASEHAGVDLGLNRNPSWKSGCVEIGDRNGDPAGIPSGQAKKQTMTKKKASEGGASGRRRNGPAEILGANSEIGRKLKQYYDELVSDEIPDRFAQLLSQLERAERVPEKD